MGRLANAIWGTAEPSATAEIAVLPTPSGDVAQVSMMPPEVAAAFGINESTVYINRREAMMVPSFHRGRNVIAGTLGTAPFVAIRRRQGSPPERYDRPLLHQPDPDVTRSYTLTWTYEDLLFYGVSWWKVTARDGQGFPSSAYRVPPYKVNVDMSTGTVRISGERIPDRDLIRFDGPDEGVLRYGGRAIRTAIMLEDAVRNFARMDVPLGYFQETDAAKIRDPEEINEFLDQWETARRARSTGFIQGGLDYRTPGFNAAQLQLTEARQHQAGEIARLLNLPPNAVNAPTNDSLTYATTESNRRELVDLTFAPFTSAVEQRLSMPDVTPIGTEVRVDLSRFIRGDLQSVITTAATAIGAGIITADEVRTDWLDMGPLPAQGGADGQVQGPAGG